MDLLRNTNYWTLTIDETGYLIIKYVLVVIILVLGILYLNDPRKTTWATCDVFFHLLFSLVFSTGGQMFWHSITLWKRCGRSACTWAIKRLYYSWLSSIITLNDFVARQIVKIIITSSKILNYGLHHLYLYYKNGGMLHYFFLRCSAL